MVLSPNQYICGLPDFGAMLLLDRFAGDLLTQATALHAYNLHCELTFCVKVVANQLKDLWQILPC